MEKRSSRKLVGMLGEARIDCTITTRSSWINPILRSEDDNTGTWEVLPDVTVASLTTLRLIQDVLSHWPSMWRKHAEDYAILRDLGQPYQPDHLRAWWKGMRNFAMEFGVKGERFVAEELEGLPVEHLELISRSVDLRTRRVMREQIVDR